MKKSILFIVIIYCGCCDDDPVKLIDLCPLCTSEVIINDVFWKSKPLISNFQFTQQADTLFSVEIYEIDPTHDDFSDVLYFRHVPIIPGEYKIDDELSSQLGTGIYLGVYQVEYGTATEIYEPVYDGSSVITVEFFNKAQKEYRISFDLVLYPRGDPEAEPYNSTFPATIHVTGESHGFVTYE